MTKTELRFFLQNKILLFTLKENNFQLFFLGQTKHIVKPRHCYTYALLSRRHNIILSSCSWLATKSKKRIMILLYRFWDKTLFFLFMDKSPYTINLAINGSYTKRN